MVKNVKILILNSGSSSIKYQLISMPSAKTICRGMIERIGEENATLSYETQNISHKEILEITSHKLGFQEIVRLLISPSQGLILNTSEIDIVGHRVVHGGRSFSETTIITNEVKNKIRELAVLAPLHNLYNLEGIILAEEVFVAAKQVAVFDTAFHQTIPTKAKKYAIPNAMYDDYNIQVYGFHGTSHKYVSEKANSFLNTKLSKIVSIHLGNGCSMTAVLNGKSIDHSLGFAPGNGLIMGSRSGDIDHSIIFHLVNTLGYSPVEASEMLMKESGMLGLTGYIDLRDIEAHADKGKSQCVLALEMNAYRIKKYLGAYAASMNGLDAIVFTAGIGENSSRIRALVCQDMEFLGIQLNDKKNEVKSEEIRNIGKDSSKVKILVIPTNEELEIAKQAYDLLSD